MRILPYFQSIQPSRPASGLERPGKTAPAEGEGAVFRLDEATQEPLQSAAGDMFIPASPVTGVVYSLSSEARASLDAADSQLNDGHTATVVKSGQYGFYRLDGKVNRIGPASKGEQLDLIS